MSKAAEEGLGRSGGYVLVWAAMHSGCRNLGSGILTVFPVPVCTDSP